MSIWGQLRGERGATGPQGAAGEPGLVWLGTWSSVTAYVSGDAVEWLGSSWICTLSHTNQEPAPTAYWDLIAAAGEVGSLEYVTNDVIDAGSGVTYVGYEDSAGAWWLKKITESGSTITIEHATEINNVLVTTYNAAWVARATLTYNDYSDVF